MTKVDVQVTPDHVQILVVGDPSRQDHPVRPSEPIFVEFRISQRLDSSVEAFCHTLVGD